MSVTGVDLIAVNFWVTGKIVRNIVGEYKQRAVYKRYKVVGNSSDSSCT